MPLQARSARLRLPENARAVDGAELRRRWRPAAGPPARRSGRPASRRRCRRDHEPGRGAGRGRRRATTSGPARRRGGSRGHARSRWITSPDGSRSGCWRSGVGQAGALDRWRGGRARGRSGPGARAAPPSPATSAIRFTPPRPERRITSRYVPRPASGVTSPWCHTSSAARSKRNWLNWPASPNSIRSGEATRIPSSRTHDVALLDDPARPHEPAPRRQRPASPLA